MLPALRAEVTMSHFFAWMELWPCGWRDLEMLPAVRAEVPCKRLGGPPRTIGPLTRLGFGPYQISVFGRSLSLLRLNTVFGTSVRTISSLLYLDPEKEVSAGSIPSGEETLYGVFNNAAGLDSTTAPCRLKKQVTVNGTLTANSTPCLLRFSSILMVDHPFLFCPRSPSTTCDVCANTYRGKEDDHDCPSPANK